MTDEAKVILNCLISCEISLYTSLYAPDEAVVPISNLMSLNKGMTKYAIRKALKELKEMGFIEYTSQGCPAIVSPSTESHYEELIDDAHPPINGYALTKKAFESEEWKTRYSEWERSMAKWAEKT